MTYHVRTLAKLGVIRLERAAPRRGRSSTTAAPRSGLSARSRLGWGSTAGLWAGCCPPMSRRGIGAGRRVRKVDPFELVIREVLVEWQQIKSQKYGHLAGGQDPAPE